MTPQVLQAETLRAPALPAGWEQQFRSSTKKFTSIPSIGVFPEALQEAVERVNGCFPQMFEILPPLLDDSLRVQVQVDLPIVKKKFVEASALFGKKITVSGLTPDEKGLFSIDELFHRGIVVQPDNGFKAHWDFNNCTLNLRHSAYSQYSGEDQVHAQVVSLLFELQNAQFSQEFREIWKSGTKFSKEAFIRKLEEIEFTTTRLTFFRLDRMAEEDEFNDDFNSYRYMYRSFPLYYLYQQALNHSYQYAQAHDTRFKTEIRRPYQGTWKVPFPQPSKEGKLSLEQTTIARILSDHLDAIYDPNQNFRAQKEREVRIAVADAKRFADMGDPRCQSIWENLQFFQEKYVEYVSEKNPERVVNLIEKPVSVTPEA